MCKNWNYQENVYSINDSRKNTLDKDIIKILDVQLDDVKIPRLQGNPIIDDDEFDGEAGRNDATSGSTDWYWYVSNERIGIVEKIANAITVDNKTSNYQSISVTGKEIRLYTISQAADFTTTLTQESELPIQFREGLAFKVISDGYTLQPMIDINLHQLFYTRYMDQVKQGRKFAKSNYTSVGNIKPTHF